MAKSEQGSSVGSEDMAKSENSSSVVSEVKSKKSSSVGGEDMAKSKKSSCVGGEDESMKYSGKDESKKYSGEDKKSSCVVSQSTRTRKPAKQVEPDVNPSLLCPHIIPLKKDNEDVLKVVSGPNVNSALGKIVFSEGRFHEKYIR